MSSRTVKRVITLGESPHGDVGFLKRKREGRGEAVSPGEDPQIASAKRSFVGAKKHTNNGNHLDWGTFDDGKKRKGGSARETMRNDQERGNRELGRPTSGEREEKKRSWTDLTPCRIRKRGKRLEGCVHFV